MRQPSGGWFQGMSAPSVDLGDVPEPLAAGDVAHRPGRVGARLAPARARSGPRCCGCTTTAPLSTSLSSSGPCATNTGRRSSTCTARCRSRAARGGRAVDAVPLRRAGRAGQGEPRHHLAEGREPCRRDDGVSQEVIAREIVDDLQCALLEFEAVATALEARAAERSGGSEPEHPCRLSR